MMWMKLVVLYFVLYSALAVSIKHYTYTGTSTKK